MLEALLAQMEAARQADAEEFSRLDYEFHQQIVRASGNRLVGKLMQTIRPMIHRQLTDHIRQAELAHREQTLRYHRSIVECLRSGDAEAARQTMYDHLTDSRRDAQQETVVKFK